LRDHAAAPAESAVNNMPANASEMKASFIPHSFLCQAWLRDENAEREQSRRRPLRAMCEKESKSFKM
jgi:hypothetical protein